MVIRFTPDADAELAEARLWYARQRQDLDVEFRNVLMISNHFSNLLRGLNLQ